MRTTDHSVDPMIRKRNIRLTASGIRRSNEHKIRDMSVISGVCMSVPQFYHLHVPALEPVSVMGYCEHAPFFFLREESDDHVLQLGIER